MNDLTEFVKLGEESLVDDIKYWQTMGDIGSLKNSLQQLQPVMDSAIKTFAQGTDNPAIRAKARVLTIKALKDYDPDKGAKPTTFIFSRLQPLRREYKKFTNPMQIPDRASMEIANLRNSRREYIDKYGKSPSQSQLADLTGFSLRKLKGLAEIEKGVMTPDFVEGDEQRGIDSYAVKAEPDPFWHTAVYQSLSPRDQKIYDFRTGSHGADKLSNKDIAKDLGISEAAISQRANKIAQQLQEFI